MLNCWKETFIFGKIGFIVFMLPLLAYSCTWGNYDDCPSWPSCSKSCGGGTRCRTCESCFWKIDKEFCETCNTFCFNGGEFLSGKCQCQYWRTGDCCEQCSHISIDHCLHGRQACGGSPDGIRCTQCESGYYPGGYGTGCLDIDECRDGYAGCDHNCENTQGSYRCSCRQGYQLNQDGRTCRDIDECVPDIAGCSQVCTNIGASFTCSCLPGYQLQPDQRSCTDINECVSGIAGCSQVCTNIDASFVCSCNPGYQLQADERLCTDINECQTGTSKCSQTCTNTAGSYICGCNPGYVLDANGATCTDINECQAGTTKCSHTCTNTAGSYICGCNQGYVLDANGWTCTDIDECTDYLNGGCDDLCINTVGSFKCACNGNSSMESDGFTCSGKNVDSPNFFSTNGLIDRLLPKGCHYIRMYKCDGNISDNIILSSTSIWYRLQSNSDVMYTFGITFVEVRTMVLPLSISGLQVDLKSKSILSGSLQYSPADGIKTGDERTHDCWTLDITPKDIHDILQSFAFTKTFFSNVQDIMPSWLQFSQTGDVVLSTSELRTEIKTGAEINSGVCQGAPLIASRFYTVLQLGHGFSIDIYGQNITLPHPFANKTYCLITDICEDLGNTVFIILPEGSRDSFDEVSMFKSLKQRMGLVIRPIGIGISLDQSINVNWESTEIYFWRGGDELFAIPIETTANVWIEGEASLTYGILRIEGKANAHVAVPNPKMILRSIFMDEWRLGAHFTATAALHFEFDFFGNNVNIKLLPSTGDFRLYGSLGGIENRNWCGPSANPPGLFLNAVMALNAFRDIPLLSFIDINLDVKVHAFMLSDPTMHITDLDKLGIVDELVKVINITETLAKTSVNAAVIYVSRLSNQSVTYLHKLTQTANLLLFASNDLLHDIRQHDVDENLLIDLAKGLSGIWNEEWKNLNNNTRLFVASIINDSLKDKFSEIFSNGMNDIQSQFGKIVDRLLNQAGQVFADNEGFGIKFYGDLTLFGLQFPSLEIEFVYSTGTKLSHCDRYEFAQNFLKNEKAIRIIGMLKQVISIGRFLKADAGLGLAISLEKYGNFALIVRAETSLLGCKGRVDMYISPTGLQFYLEVRIWSAFKAQLDVSFNTHLELMKHTVPVLESVALNVKGRFIADADGDGDFSDSYLSALMRYTQYIADEANARLSGVQNTLTAAQRDVSAAQIWLENKKSVVSSAKAGFDDAVRALDVAKLKLDEAKKPFQNAINALEDAQRKVDRLCKIKTCDQICVPGLKCSVCSKKVWFITIWYPCCSFTNCMFSIPDPICELANAGCYVLRGIAYAALEVAQLAIRVPMLVLDAAKVAVSVAQVVVDKSRVVLDVAQVALNMAQIALEGVNIILESAKLALEAVKAVVKLGFMALNFVLKYGIQSLIDVRNCHFEIELSTSDLPIFDVQCEVNAFKTGFVTVGININFNDPVQSIWNAAKATIEMILKTIGNIVSGRKRREIRDKTLTGLYRAMRLARNADVDDTHFEMFANQTLNASFNTYTSENTSQSDEYTFRKQLYTKKCLQFTGIHVFFYETANTLLELVHDTAATIRNMTSLKGSLQTFNLHAMSDNLSYTSIGVDPKVAQDEFNISISELEEAIDGARGNISTDPLLANIASFAEDASTFLEDEAEGANKIMIVNQWIAAMNNVTIEYFDNETCASFLDCAHYAIAVLYEQFMAVNVTNQTESIDSISEFEDTFLLLVGNGSHTIDDVDSMTMSLLATLQQMKEHYVFCSKAPEMLEPLKNLTVKTGSTVALVCNATGNPIPNFSWYKSGQLIPDQYKMVFAIANAKKEDSGAYHCLAGNLVANYSFEEAYVTVLDISDVVDIEEVIDDENGVNLEAILIPICVLLACALAIVGILVWRHHIRMLARTKVSAASFANADYMVRPQVSKPKFDSKAGLEEMEPI